MERKLIITVITLFLAFCINSKTISAKIEKYENSEMNLNNTIVLSYNISDYNGYNLSCFGENDGFIQAIASGGTPPFSYLWSTGDTIADLQNLAAGTYYLTVSDFNSQIVTDSISLSQADELYISPYIYQTSSIGATDGSISIYISGGNTPYSFLWSNGETNEDLSNIQTGLYSFTVSDANSCFAIDSFLVPEGIFHEVSGLNIIGIEDASVDWGDYDNDGDLDFIFSGTIDGSSTNAITRIYKNQGNDVFSILAASNIEDLCKGTVSWADYNNDGLLDFLATGYTYLNERKSIIYRNNGNDTFTEITSANIEGIAYSSVDWGDYDNDGDLDILIAGSSVSNYYSTKIYKNNGNDSFTELTNLSLIGITYGEAKWGDFDKDGDLDIFLSGRTSLDRISTIFSNEGNDNFSQISGLPFVVVAYSSVAWGDYDSDGDLDLLLTGNEDYYSSDAIVKIYKNNGNFDFSELSGLFSNGIYNGSVAWGDCNNDGLLDVILTGDCSYSFVMNKILKNNGDDTFTDLYYFPLGHLDNSSIDIGDYDNDGDLDIIETGYYNSNTNLFKLFKNDINSTNNPPSAPENLQTSFLSFNKLQLSWNQTTDDLTPQNGITYNFYLRKVSGEIIYNSMADINTGYRKISESGNAAFDTSFTVQYLDTGVYIWSVQAIDNCYLGSEFAITDTFEIQVKITPNLIDFGTLTTSISDTSQFISIFNLSQDTIVIDSLNLLEEPFSIGFNTFPIEILPGDSIFIEISINQAFTNGFYNETLNIYSSDFSSPILFEVLGGISLYEIVTGTNIEGVQGSIAEWGDYDNDGDLDLLLFGQIYNYPNTIYKNKLYKNNGNDTFTEIAEFPAIQSTDDIEWGDYDNDGDLDFIVAGRISYYDGLTKIYKNNGNDTFTELVVNDLEQVRDGAVAWGDCDNDGDLDILLTGERNSYYPISKIYINNGNDNFSALSNISIEWIEDSEQKWVDFDNDSDLDFLLSGIDNANNKITKLYINEGENSFTESQTAFQGFIDASIACGDYDQDGDIDILICGSTDYNNAGIMTKLYKNQGNNQFLDIIGFSIPEVYNQSIAFGDYDNDGDLDVLISGSNSWTQAISRIYRNEGNDIFTEVKTLPFEGISFGTAIFGDYDNDKDLDVFLSGSNALGQPVCNIYKNYCLTENNPPTPPTYLEISITGFNDVKLAWNPASDDHSLQNSLSYNVYLYKIGGDTIWNSMSNISSGNRKIVSMGSTNLDTSWTINNLVAGTYAWSVQAIDNSFIGSEFALEDTFETTINISPNSVDFGQNLPNINDTSIRYTISNFGQNTITIDSLSQISQPFSYTTTSLPYQIIPGDSLIIHISFNRMHEDGYFEQSLNIYSSVSLEPTVLNIEGEIHYFTEVQGNNIEGLYEGITDWADYDNDGDLDFIIAGRTSSWNVKYTRVYQNFGNNSFVYLPSTPFSGVSNGSTSWGDYDNDGDLDVLLTGSQYSSPSNISRIYKNLGNGNFSLLTDLYGMSLSEGEWADFDNDGDLDILISSNYYGTKLYKNEGNDIFTEMADLGFPNNGGAIDWGDYDNDMDLDVLFYSGNSDCIVYRNDGNDTFYEISISTLSVNTKPRAYWSDLDNDGDLDIFLLRTTTSYNSSDVSAFIYENIGNDNFSEITGLSMIAPIDGSVDLGDYDNDGDIDIFLCGKKDYSPKSWIYKNNGNFSFTEFPLSSITGATGSSSKWGDYDNDGDLDLLLTGHDGTDIISTVFKNNCLAQNNPPLSPQNLNSFATRNDEILLSWDKSTDDVTPQNSLSYNSFLYKVGGDTIWSSMSDNTSGLRRIPDNGNASKDTSWLINNLNFGTYNWSVQTVDRAYSGSEFAIEASFEMNILIESETIDFDTVSISNISDTTKYFTISNFSQNDIILDSIKIENNVFSCGINNFSYTILSGDSLQIPIIMHRTQIGYSESVIDIYISQFPLPSQILAKGSVSQFVKVEGLQFQQIANGYVSWGDCDNDNDLDILLTGSTNSDTISRIYINEGNDIFNEITTANIDGVENSVTDWGDYDKDGDLDILIVGGSNNSTAMCKIYRNDGNNIFIELTNLNLEQYYDGAAAWGDYDNDGDLDFIYSGTKIINQVYTKIYENKGNDIFEPLVGANITGFYDNSIAWGDYDNDSDLDILISGRTTTYSGDAASKVYKNNGNGNFTELTNLPFVQIYKSEVSWGDYDNDGDLDILLNGTTSYSGSEYHSKIYKNIGNDSFTELIGMPFENLGEGSLIWGDYDNDGDLDVFSSGKSGPWQNIIIKSIMYLNEGNDIFTESEGYYLENVYNSSIVSADYDNDGDLDILLTGLNQSEEPVTILYKNHTFIQNNPPQTPTNISSEIVAINETKLSWNKTTDDNTPQDGLSYNAYIYKVGGDTVWSSMANINTGFRKIPKIGNSNLDTTWTINSLETGLYKWSVQAIDNSFFGSEFAIEESFEIFTQIDETILDFGRVPLHPSLDSILSVKIKNSAQNSLSINNIVINSPYSHNIPNLPYTIAQSDSLIIDVSLDRSHLEGKYYDTLEIYFAQYNHSTEIILKSYLARFTELPGLNLPEISRGTTAWGDYDGDGDLDVLLTGRYSIIDITKLYKNIGNDNFQQVVGLPFANVMNSSAAWGDCDKDGDLDLFLSGYTDNGPISRIYKNEGDDLFTEMSFPFPNLESGAVAWGDYDNDGDLDILLSGMMSYQNYFTYIFKNAGDFDFNLISTPNIPYLRKSSVAWGDYDKDNDLDILISGSSSTEDICNVYKNMGNDTFSALAEFSVSGDYGTVEWADFNNDGYLDILFAGQNNFNSEIYIYLNQANDTFINISNLELSGARYGKTTWGDCDNDGDLDIFTTGENSSEHITKIYKNQGNNVFTEMGGSDLVGVQNSSLSLGDYDFDGDLDFILLGEKDTYNKLCRIYKNHSYTTNNPPLAPNNLSSEINDTITNLSWEKSTDDHSSQNALSYNGYLYKVGGDTIWSSMSDINSGFRRIPALGNASLNTSWAIKNLSSGNYHWSVQAIDNSYSGSPFAPEQLISIFGVDFVADTTIGYAPLQVQFTDLSTGNILLRYWDFGDGNTSMDQNPVHIFADTGSYTIQLIVSDGVEIDTLIKLNYIFVEEGTFVPNFADSKPFILHQNKPNPFAETTEISFYIPKQTEVEISIYNILGEKIQTLVSKTYSIGEHSIKFNSKNYNPGTYFYKMTCPDFVDTKNMIILE